MTYYNTITSKALFEKSAEIQTFESLYRSDNFERGVSRWHTPHLFASRVICAPPQSRIPLLARFFPHSARGIHAYIDRLIDGPPVGLRAKFEPQIVQENQPDGLGYVWAALAQLLRAENQAPVTTGESSTRGSTRGIQPTQHEGFITSTRMRVGSSSPIGSESTSTSLHTASDWVDKLSSHPFEDLVVRLASCLIRFVVNYSQPTDKTSPIHFRDERLVYGFQYREHDSIKAIDDGGLQVYRDARCLQVAMLEGKRAFKEFIAEGIPTVPDHILGQLVGEALAQRRMQDLPRVALNDLITILTISRRMKFFHFHITNDFINGYEDPSPTTDYLRVQSSHWYDIGDRSDRKKIVKYIIAILRWADESVGGGNDSSDDAVEHDSESSEDESMES